MTIKRLKFRIHDYIGQHSVYRNDETGILIINRPRHGGSGKPAGWAIFPPGAPGHAERYEVGKRLRTLAEACNTASAWWHHKQQVESTEASPAKRINDAVTTIESIVRDLVDPPTPSGRPDPALTDEIDELIERLVRRAQHIALVRVGYVLDGWIAGAEENHEALGHRDRDCCRSLAPSDITRMLNEAARELKTAEPFPGAIGGAE